METNFSSNCSHYSNLGRETLIGLSQSHSQLGQKQNSDSITKLREREEEWGGGGKRDAVADKRIQWSQKYYVVVMGLGSETRFLRLESWL